MSRIRAFLRRMRIAATFPYRWVRRWFGVRFQPALYIDSRLRCEPRHGYIGPQTWTTGKRSRFTEESDIDTEDGGVIARTSLTICPKCHGLWAREFIEDHIDCR